MARWMLTTMILLASGATCVAQDAVPTGSDRSAIPQMDEIQPGRLPLLREGTVLVQVPGRMHRHEPSGLWVFSYQTSKPDMPPQMLIMLPSTLLAEMEQVIASVGDVDVLFETTGRVFVYDGRNYLLPTTSPRLVDHEATPDDFETVGADDPTEENATPADDSVESIMSEMMRDVGPIARSPATADPAARRLAPDLTPEGTPVVLRRGKLRRDQFGAWVFVFDSDAEGTEDPSMIVLPCLLLEKMGEAARETGYQMPLLLSGETLTYKGSNYLLPTMFQIPREQTVLTP